VAVTTRVPRDDGQEPDDRVGATARSAYSGLVARVTSIAAAGVCAVTVLGMAGQPSAAADSAAHLRLGFVRGPNIFLASPNGAAERVVLKGTGNHYYYDPAWSRGGRLAFTSYTQPRAGFGHGFADVQVRRPGKRPIDIPAGDSSFDGSPAWSRDGRRLVSIGYQYDSGGSLYLAHPGDKESSRLPGSLDLVDDQPAWSPSETIVFSRKVGKAPFRLFTVRPGSATVNRLTGSKSYNPSWSPDGKWIVFDDGRDIKVVRADGSDAHRLTTTRTPETDPAWAPDGSLIAYVRKGNIWTMHPDGTNARLVIDNADQPSWKLLKGTKGR
jgi:Tol biopolymer transport system component